jgi:hypothetical protein
MQDNDLKVVNISLALAALKYLGMTVTNENYIQK